MGQDPARSVPRKEDDRLLRGRGRFVSDLELPRQRHVAFVRSDLAHALIRRIDTDAAEAAGARVFTASSAGFDVVLRARSALPGYVETTQPVLASGKVRFAGEALALVVAADRYVAEDAAELVEAELDPLPAAVSTEGHPAYPVHDEAPDNVLLTRRFQAGDAAAALAASALVVRRVLHTNRHGGTPLEGRAVVARWDDDRHLTVWTGTQVPHLARNLLAELLGLREANVRVIAPDVGGGFGVKAVLYPEEVAVCLAARAVPGVAHKWVEDRREHLHAATHARDHRYELAAGFDAGGLLLGIEGRAVCNTGAYSVYPWTAGIEPLMAGGLLAGPYRVGHYDVTVSGVATNTAPSGPYRGVARPATVFAMETLLDDAAAGLAIDPVELRRRNLIGPGDVPYRMATNLVDDTGHYGECLDRAVELLGLDGWRAEQARRRTAGERPIGIGFACYNELTGLGRAASAGPRMPFRTGHEACTVRIEPDGTVTVLSGVTSQGQGLETTMAQVVAEALGVAVDDVEVRYGDTGESLWGFGAFSSRQAVIAGGAARLGALAVRDQLLALAAEVWEANPDDLELRDGAVHVAGTRQPLGQVAELARIAYLESNRLPAGVEPGLHATRFYDPVLGAFAAGAQTAVVEVDPERGTLRILRWVCVEDPGRIVNAAVVHGQVVGSIAQGIGGALLEHHVYDDVGNLLTASLLDYLMPGSADVPDLVVDHVCHPADNPTGVRGVGEGGTLGPAAVLAGAVRDAVGIPVDELPLSPERIWESLGSAAVAGRAGR